MRVSPELAELLHLVVVPAAGAERFSLVGYPERPGATRAPAASVATPPAWARAALVLAAEVISGEGVVVAVAGCTAVVVAVAVVRALLPPELRMSVPGQRIRELLMVLRRLRRRRSVR